MQTPLHSPSTIRVIFLLGIVANGLWNHAEKHKKSPSIDDPR